MLHFPDQFRLIDVGRDKVNRTTGIVSTPEQLETEVRKHLLSHNVAVDEDTGAVYAGIRVVGHVQNTSVPK